MRSEDTWQSANCHHRDDKSIKRFLRLPSKVYKKEKELKKGIAFPTCLSVNNCVCHFSPAKNDADYTLKAGDVVKM